MRKSIVAALTAGVIAALPAAPALAAPAAIQACTARYTCTFEHTDFTGPLEPFSNPVSRGWIHLPVSERASAEERGRSDVWFWNKSSRTFTCVPVDHENPALGHPGFMFVDYGVSRDCHEAPPAGAPGS